MVTGMGEKGGWRVSWKPSIRRDVLGAVLLALVGVLYVAGLSGGEPPPKSGEVTVEFGEISPIMVDGSVELKD